MNGEIVEYHEVIRHDEFNCMAMEIRCCSRPHMTYMFDGCSTSISMLVCWYCHHVQNLWRMAKKKNGSNNWIYWDNMIYYDIFSWGCSRDMKGYDKDSQQ